MRSKTPLVDANLKFCSYNRLIFLRNIRSEKYIGKKIIKHFIKSKIK